MGGLRWNETVGRIVGTVDNATIDDISAAIGFTGATMLQAWYGGQTIRLPVEFRADWALVHLLGRARAQALWRVFRQQHLLERITVPKGEEARRYARDVAIARMLAAGDEIAAVCHRFDLSERQVLQLRKDLVDRGWLRWDMDGRKYRLVPTVRGSRRRAVLLGTSEVSDEPPPPVFRG